jgi:hypothetical protein
MGATTSQRARGLVLAEVLDRWTGIANKGAQYGQGNWKVPYQAPQIALQRVRSFNDGPCIRHHRMSTSLPSESRTTYSGWLFPHRQPGRLGFVFLPQYCSA